MPQRFRCAWTVAGSFLATPSFTGFGILETSVTDVQYDFCTLWYDMAKDLGVTAGHPTDKQCNLADSENLQNDGFQEREVLAAKIVVGEILSFYKCTLLFKMASKFDLNQGVMTQDLQPPLKGSGRCILTLSRRQKRVDEETKHGPLCET
jgi:hypothetical protein